MKELAVRVRAVRLEQISIVVASLEALGGLSAGIVSTSVAVTSFGADSVVEIVSAVIVMRQVVSLVRSRDLSPRSFHRAHRGLAIMFFTLGAYVLISVAIALTQRHHAHEGALGVGVAMLSLVVMPLLAVAKRASARDLSHHGYDALARLMSADASETALCAVLAASTLVGVAAAWIHWWWADPAASLLVIYFALREGREAWECSVESAESPHH